MTKGSAVLRFRKLNPTAKAPTRAHPDDAGLDLYAVDGADLRPGASAMVATGVSVEVPEGHVGLILDRSSMARLGLKTAGGVIDAGYRGEVGVILWNISKQAHRLSAGDRIAQLLIVPIAVPAVEEAEDLTETERGAKGFGSTGR